MVAHEVTFIVRRHPVLGTVPPVQGSTPAPARLLDHKK